MAALHFQVHEDPTLEAIDAEIERRGNSRPHSHSVGMSTVGDACLRRLWYAFRWCTPRRFNADTLKLFEDGHQGEKQMAERLRQVPALKLHTHDPATGQQYESLDHGGHLRGFMDGAIWGLHKAPKTWHVWEHKQTAETKFNALVKLITERGEKAALEKWNFKYWVQAQLYMWYEGLTRHYMTVSTRGGCRTVSLRTNAQKKKAKVQVKRALEVIMAERPLERLSDKPSYFECKWCDHQATCHGQAVPAPSCRTCIYATPELDGVRRWSCQHHGIDLDLAAQAQGCSDHRFIPDLIPYAEPADASTTENWIQYRTTAGTVFYNGEKGPMSFTSEELHHAAVAMIGDPGVETLRARLDASFVSQKI